MESYPVHFFLPNPRMTEEGQKQYGSMGLNEREIEIVRTSQPQRHVYYKTPLGSRLFELTPGPVTHAFLSAPEGKSNADVRAATEAMIAEFGEEWPAEWLRQGGLRQWAEYVEAERNTRQEVDDETLDLFAELVP